MTRGRWWGDGTEGPGKVNNRRPPVPTPMA